MTSAPVRFSRFDASIDALIARYGPHLVVAMPLGLSKPNPWINALYARVQSDPALRLTIVTALSLDSPHAKGTLERRFLEPFAARVFGDYPNMQYSLDAKREALPPNIEVFEFFLLANRYIGNGAAQRRFIYSNYTHVVRDALALGINVFAQAIAVEDGPAGPRYSLSCNTDLTLEALDAVDAEGKRPFAMLGVVNRAMPFMVNDAEIAAERFDYLVDDPAGTHTLFAPPNQRVDDQDYGIALWSSALVKDGGTLQIGIGSLGDGIAQALILRERDNAAYLAALHALGKGSLPGGLHTRPFDEGLYGCSEMFVNGFMALIDAGILRREVFDDLALQTLLHQRRIGRHPDDAMLAALLEAGAVGSPLSAADVDWLRRWGILREAVELRDGHLHYDGLSLPASLSEPATRAAIAAAFLGDHLKGGYVLHGGFILGCARFYQRLRELSPALRRKINMTGVRYINQLFGQERLAAMQRRDARFINTTMMVTVLGAAVSDGLDTGDMISGIGGQYNFVEQGQTLPDGRSILVLRAWRMTREGQARSNIVWQYGHTSVPRHMRDIYITEYGIADVRGQPDGEVVKRMLAITDSRFQDELLASAKRYGKIEADYVIPAAQRNNRPEVLAQALATARGNGLLPDYPFGTDLTPVELELAQALMTLKARRHAPLALLKTVLRGLTHPAPADWLERMALEHPRTLKERVLRTLLAGCAPARLRPTQPASLP